MTDPSAKPATRAPSTTTIPVWRHPRVDAAGRCIGQLDLCADPRAVRRLARRIHRALHTAGGTSRPLVVTSPLRRCRAVGQALRRLGWQHRTDATLLEMDFGSWTGQNWDAIGVSALDAWCMDFLDGRPGLGESLRQFLTRAAAWQAPPGCRTVVGHGGWMTARDWLAQPASIWPQAATWPSAPACGQYRLLPAETLPLPRASAAPSPAALQQR